MPYREIEAHLKYEALGYHESILSNLPYSIFKKDPFRISIYVPQYLLGTFYEEVIRRAMPSLHLYGDSIIGEYIIRLTSKDQIVVKHDLLESPLFTIDISEYYKNILLEKPEGQFLFKFRSDTEQYDIPLENESQAQELIRYFLMLHQIAEAKNVKWIDSFADEDLPETGYGLYFQDGNKKFHLIWKNGEKRVSFQGIEMWYEEGLGVVMKEDSPEFAVS